MAASNAAQWTERGMATASGALLLGVVAAVDERVRGRVFGVLSGDISPEVSAISTQLRRAARFASETGGSEEMTLVLFIVAAMVLLGFMFFV